MTEPRAFASLTPSLLARKGGARPAMRPQIAPIAYDDQHRVAFGGGHARPADHGSTDHSHAHLDDLGWNDMGETPSDGALTPHHPAVLPAEPVVPEVVRQMKTLAQAVAEEAPAVQEAQAVEQVSVPSEPEVAPQPARRHGVALASGRKAAFTLRLDADRHFRLRLASTLENRSAQQVVTDALDRFLETVPGLEDLARRIKRP